MLLELFFGTFQIVKLARIDTIRIFFSNVPGTLETFTYIDSKKEDDVREIIIFE